MPTIKLNSSIEKDGLFFEDLFYQKIILYSKDKGSSWDNKIPIKELNRRFSILFLTREQTFAILKKLQDKGLIKIEKKEVIING